MKKNKIILKQNQVCNYLYYINNGIVREYYLKKGKEVTASFGFKNSIISSFASFLSRKPSFEALETLEKTELMRIHHDKLQNLYCKYPEINTLGRKITEFYYLTLEDRIFASQFCSAKERYFNLLKQEPDITQKVSLGYIASFLGITQETLSRIRARRP
ncbi:MAG: Crp/Fnr family transcriptional regulator [Saprospiraceae bacterium]